MLPNFVYIFIILGNRSGKRNETRSPETPVLRAAGCQRHFYWVYQLGLELHERYHTIYHKTHKCLNHLKRLMEIDLCKIPVTITLNEWYKLPFVKPRVDTIFKKRICTRNLHKVANLESRAWIYI